jgi:protocatechuate 3,4-dioxygenase beta subunit
MYFPGDPLIPIDPIANGAPPEALQRMISRFDIDTTEDSYALSHIFDIVLRGRAATPFEDRP